MLGRIRAKQFMIFLCGIVTLSVPFLVFAQNETSYDLVNEVNNLRALHGLEPYRIDPWLMTYAQEHSEYQASIMQGTHLHSDGTLPQDIGLQENVAGGDVQVISAAIVVYEIWVDWGHRHILTGFETGEIGAGIAYDNNGQVYYTVNIRPGEELPQTTPTTPEPYTPLETVTPVDDGTIIHIVGYGQTLWSIAIAYGITVNDIRSLNGIASDSDVITIGQKLIIRPANIFSPTPMGTNSDFSTESSTPSPEDKPVSTVSTSQLTATLNATSIKTSTPSPEFTPSPTQEPVVSTTKKFNNPIAALGLSLLVVVFLALVILGYRQTDRGNDPDK